MSDEHPPTGERPATPDEPLDDPWLVDRVLSGEASDEWSSLADLFAAASGPAQPDELLDELDAVASFVAAREAAASGGESRSGSPSGRGGRGGRRVAVVSTLLAGRFAAVTVAGVVTLGAGGMAAAAYTGMLPAPLQDVAHRTIGAPMPERTTSSPTATASPSESLATSSTTTTTAPRVQQANPAPGTSSVVTTPARPVADLCADWRQQQMPTAGPVFTALSQAVSGSVDTFCASLTTPTTAPTTTPSASSTDEPTTTPSDTSSSTDTPSSGPSTASDSPSGPPMTASDQPTLPLPSSSAGTEGPTTEPTGP